MKPRTLADLTFPAAGAEPERRWLLVREQPQRYAVVLELGGDRWRWPLALAAGHVEDAMLELLARTAAQSGYVTAARAVRRTKNPRPTK